MVNKGNPLGIRGLFNLKYRPTLDTHLYASALRFTFAFGLFFISLDLSCSAASTLTVDVAGHAEFSSINAAIAKAGAGDTLLVKPGIYRESVKPKSHLRILSELGPVRTSIFVEHGGRGLLIDHVDDVTIEGFDIHSVLGVGKPGDGLVNITNSTDITVRDCYIHDAPNDSDCVKVSDTRRLLLERCCIWNPASRDQSTKAFQEGMDTRVRDFEIIVRGCWFFQQDKIGDTLIYCKGGCFDILWEDNIFGPSAGEGHANVPVQSGHQNAGEWRDYVPPYPSGRFVVRNNLFVGLKGEAAFGFQGPDTSLLYNNVFYRNETKPSLITVTDNPGAKGGPALNLFCFNNIYAANGTQPIYRQRNAAASLKNLKCGHNLYSQIGNGGDMNVEAETGAITNQDPGFVAPSVPVFDFNKGTQQIRQARAGFQTSPSSPARGAGIDPGHFVGSLHPDAIPDMRNGLGATSKSIHWDVGLREFTATGQQPKSER